MRKYILILFASIFLMSCSEDDLSWKEELESIKAELLSQKKIIEALQANANITSVKQDKDSYTINFSNGQSITLTNGITPIITIGENGNWYINGQDTGKPSRGENGKDGINGTNGADGKDGVTPTIEIKDGYWYINGINTNVKAEGVDGNDGINGIDGQDAPSLKNVIIEDSSIIIVFSDGTQISIPFDINNYVNSLLPNDKCKLDTICYQYDIDTKDLIYTYNKPLFSNLDVFQRTVYAVEVFLINKTNTDILIYDRITSNYISIQTIYAEQIVPNSYNFILLHRPVYLQANQYIGFSGNVAWAKNDGLYKNGGCFIASTKNPGTWEKTSALFGYKLYATKSISKLKGKKLSIFGDSISTSNYDGEDSDGDGSDFENAELTIDVNKGSNYWKRFLRTTEMSYFSSSIKGGTTIMTGLRGGVPFTDKSRFENIYRPDSAPDYIFVFGGINDFVNCELDDSFKKYANIGSFEDGDNDPSISFYSAYSYLLKTIKQLYPTVNIVCITPIKCFNEKRYSNKDNFVNLNGISLSEFIDATKKIAKKYDAQVVDLYNKFPANWDNWKLYYTDTFHPNFAGYAIIEQIMLEEL